MTVPVDYRDPGGETIDLALNKVAGRDPSAGDRAAGGQPRRPRRARHRLRRAGAARPSGPSCSTATTSSASTRAAPATPTRSTASPTRSSTTSSPRDPDPDDAAEDEAFAAGQETFFAGCVERSDSLIGHVTTVETARDLDVIRAALGQTTLTYFGASYGTKLGATYAELFPEQVGRLVLDGAVDVSLPSRELSLGQAGGFETALRAYVDDCVADGDCFLGDTVDEGMQTISDLLDDIDAAAAADPAGPRARRSATPSTASSPRSTTATTGRCSTRA